MNYTVCVAKIKTLISFAVTTKLKCLFSRMCEKQVFSRGSIIDKLIGEFSLTCGSFNAREYGKNRVTSMMLSEV